MSEIDKSTFEQLKQDTGDDFIKELIDTFLEDAPDLINQIKSAHQAGDANSFRRAAHSMKSNAATFGAMKLSELAKELETLGRENKLNNAGDNVKSLENTFGKVRDELRSLIS